MAKRKVQLPEPAVKQPKKVKVKATPVDRALLPPVTELRKRTPEEWAAMTRDEKRELNALRRNNKQAAKAEKKAAKQATKKFKKERAEAKERGEKVTTSTRSFMLFSGITGKYGKIFAYEFTMRDFFEEEYLPTDDVREIPKQHLNEPTPFTHARCYKATIISRLIWLGEDEHSLRLAEEAVRKVRRLHAQQAAAPPRKVAKAAKAVAA